MANQNEFPESGEKAYLRHMHLKYLAQRHASTRRLQAYLGLPSVEMLDGKLWKPYLGQITAIERDPDLALFMFQTAMRLGIRDRTTILEGDVAQYIRLLSLDDRDAGGHTGQLPPADQFALRRARSTAYDIFHLDPYGGFLYPTGGESANANVLKHFVRHQARHSSGCVLAVNFAFRDTGREDYLSFISDVLNRLEEVGVDTSDVRAFYTSDEREEGQPPSLKRLRFCVPAYVQKIAFDDFEVKLLGAWTYKTFYHVALLLEPRKGKSSLGTWPPIDEFKELLRAPLVRLDLPADSTDWEKVTTTELAAPAL